jgi:glycosyltransferase 2 family protein
MKRNLALELFLIFIGIGLFIAAILFAGLSRVLAALSRINWSYSLPFVIASFLLVVASSYRWKAVLDGSGTSIGFWSLLRYKVAAFGVNYITPAARMGGEPLKVFLMKKHGVGSPKSFASVIIDNFVGMGVDVILTGAILLVLGLPFLQFPVGQRIIFLTLGIGAFVVVILAYFFLVKEKTIFSHILDFFGRIGNIEKTLMFQKIRHKLAESEIYMKEMLIIRKQNLLFAVGFGLLSWPLTIIQYKFALLMLGINASIFQIFFGVIILNISIMLPIPAALGVQEASLFSAFQLFSVANPYLGIALSLLLRLKDAVLLLISWILLSKEGMNIIDAVKNSFNLK